MNKKIIGLLAVATCYVLIGSSYPIAQEAVSTIPTWTFTGITIFIGFLFQLPFSLFKEKTNWISISLKDWSKVSVVTLLGNILYTVFLLYGMSNTNATTAAVVSSSVPALVLLLSFVFLKDKLKSTMIISVALAIVSVIMMSIPEKGSDTSSSFFGMSMLALSALSNAIYVIVAKKLTLALKTWTYSAAICFAGFIFTLPMILSELNNFDIYSLNSYQVITMIYYGIFVWALPIYLFLTGIKYVSATTAGMMFSFIPLSSLLTTVFFYNGHVRTIDVISIIMVITSVIISEVTFKKSSLKNQTKTA
ncbi:DMT family transporter [Candidatus Pantoea bituminis]|uniref:DMT family transporter n=1 Tax=Candidatus Pantoea bituminis TaxID=2831036 RepID=UPI001C060893|nr:DMT family transporter [Pantoea bituminis]